MKLLPESDYLKQHLSGGMLAGIITGSVVGFVVAGVVLRGPGVMRPLGVSNWAVIGYCLGAFGLLGWLLGLISGLVGALLPGRHVPLLLHGLTLTHVWLLAPVALWINMKWLPAFMSSKSLAANVGLVVTCGLSILILERLLKRRLGSVRAPHYLIGVLQAALLLVVVLLSNHAGTGVRQPDTGSAFLMDGSAAPAELRHIVLVTIDTLRPDHMGLYGYQRPTTPQMDAFAEDALVFERCHASAPNTQPSLAVLHTSLNLVHFHHRAVADFVPAHYNTLAESLLSAGYTTLGVVANPLAGGVVGLHQGFVAFDEHSAMVRPSEEVTDAALALLDHYEGAEPIFLWVHYLDPHGPYLPREESIAAFDSDGESARATRDLVLENPGKSSEFWIEFLRMAGSQAEARPERFRSFVDLYDAELAETDAALGRLLDELRQRGLYHDTVLALSSDHGEEFMEHGGVLHGTTLYEELVRVPLILRAPGLPRGERVNQQFQLLDLAPTLLALAGVPPPAVWEGRGLPAVVGGDPKERPVLLEKLHATVRATAPLVAVVQDGHKLIMPAWRPYLFGLDPSRFADSLRFMVLYLGGPDPTLYDLGQSGERTDLSRSDPATAAKLQQTLHRMYRSSALPGSEGELDPETVERLRALGYLTP